MMRNTPLKRTGGLKRTPMRRKGKAKRTGKDPKVIARLVEEQPGDEVEYLLRGDVWSQVKAGWNLPMWIETNHVLRASHGKKLDLRCNLVRMTNRAHHYFHKDHFGGIVVCMLAVVRRESDKPLILKEWHEAFGKHPLWWLHDAMRDEEVPEHYMDHAVEVLKAFRFELNQ